MVQRLYLTSLPALPACLRVLATTAYRLPPTCCCCSSCLHATYFASDKPYPPIHTPPPIHPSSQPYPGLSRRLPASHPSHSIQTLSQLATGPSLTTPPLLCLPSLAFRPWRSPGPSFLHSRGTRRRATPCALGNYLRTTCGICKPRGDRAPWTGWAHNAQGKQSTSRLTSSPTIPIHASSNCLSTHSPASPSALPAHGPAVECAQSQQSVLSLPKPNATRRCHCYPACCCCSYCFFPPHLTSSYPFHVLIRLALCIRCRHWRLCSRFLPGHRRKPPLLTLRPQPARGCFSGLQHSSSRSRNERNCHRDVYFTLSRPLLLCFQPLRSILRSTNRPLRPLPIG